ncbi:MAG: hypothetical protein E7647_00510 [Ruminococcaceae bacterium]|nr:hypothetical protein [Oscillospiraceae bacterium]
MAKNKITTSFRLFSVGAVLLSVLISKLLHITYMWAYSDVTVPAPFVYVSYYGYDLFNLMAVAFTFTAVVYAHSYFGRKTCTEIALLCFASLFVGKAVMFIYNLIENELQAAQLISGALSYTVEILFDALFVILAIIFSNIFAKKRDCSGKENSKLLYSPIKAAFSTAGAYSFILIADLTVMNVIPFIVKYGTPTETELKSIFSDYLYYIFSFPFIILLILLGFFLTVKVTGKLRTKQYYQSK